MRVRFHRIGLIGATVLAGVLVAGASAHARGVTGSVNDVEGNPISGAAITIVAEPMPATPTATAAETGEFSLPKVASTDVTLRVSAQGYKSTDVVLKGARTAAVLKVVLVKEAPPPTRTLTGLVRDQDGNAIAGGIVKIQGAPNGVTTDADGFFILVDVPADTVTLEFSSPAHRDDTLTVPPGGAATSVKMGLQSMAPTEPPPPATRNISGRLLDPDLGEPIAGASVIVAGGTVLGISEDDGRFVLEGAPVGDVVIQVEATGYALKTVPVAAATNAVEIALDSAATGEVIVVQGRQPVIMKQNLANGASVVSAEDLTRVSAATLEGGLQGKVSGANLQANSGAPGGGAQIRLRGISTINGQSSPLIVVDGVIISNAAISAGANAITAASAGGNASTQDNPTNRLADLNPNDIETVEVLKGAAAGALYGSKAANGVVIISTKKGSAGSTRVNVTQRFGVAQRSNKLGSRVFGSAQEVMDTYGNQAAVDAFNAAGGRTFDHEDQMSQTAIATETIASAAGGTDDGSYFGSVLVRDEPGIIKGSFYEKQAGKITVGYDFSDRVTVGLSGNLVHSVSDRGLTNNDNSGTSYYVALSSTPSFVDLREQASGIFPNNPFAPSNPLQTQALLSNREEIWRLIGSANVGVKLWSNSEHDVSAASIFGVDRFQQQNNIVSPPELQFEGNDGLLGTIVDADNGNLNYNVGVSGSWQFKPKSDAFRSALTAGFSHEVVDLVSVYVTGQNLAAGQPNVDSVTVIGTNEVRLRTEDQGLYLQEEIAVLNDKLSVLAGILAERSSLNGDPDKFFLFPKVAATYSVPVPEKHFEDLRVRAAYGEAGNRPNYGQKFTPLNASVSIDREPGIVLGGSVGDANIEPERQREFEFGADVISFDSRGVLELTVYQRNISNLLLQRALPTSTGFTTEFFNGGTMRNRGLEAALQLRPVDLIAGDGLPVTWTTRAILTLNRSEVTSLPDGIEFFDITNAGFGAGLGAYRIEPGKSATQIVASAGDLGVIPVGNGEPDFRVGWSNKVEWKDLTFTALLDWQQGSDVVNLTRLLYDANQVSEDFNSGGSERIGAFGGGDARPYIEDASFLKLREVSVNYKLPKSVVEQFGPVKYLGVGLSGRDLLTFTNYSGLDPEVSNFGGQPIGRNYDVGPYPPSRSYWLSISAGL